MSVNSKLKNRHRNINCLYFPLLLVSWWGSYAATRRQILHHPGSLSVRAKGPFLQSTTPSLSKRHWCLLLQHRLAAQPQKWNSLVPILFYVFSPLFSDLILFYSDSSSMLPTNSRVSMDSIKITLWICCAITFFKS